jgi:transposase
VQRLRPGVQRLHRHRAAEDPPPLPAAAAEADEMDQNAGEKRRPASRPEGPAPSAGQQETRARQLGHRPTAGGWGGRARERAVYLEVLDRASRADLERVVEDNTAPFSAVSTDEWAGYDRLPGLDRGHATVCHAPGRREWARDDDGDGIREVHNNTLEGLWAGLRTFLRPFRGVSKWLLDQYVAMFQWAYNLKAVTDAFLRVLFGVSTANAP